ncbi:MAG TPA: hypothetical protein VL945_01480 [Candidatus Saccharimonadales bacterium]|nr:hypothetical protein [Candidatus Saccharimonadales bacterium]
MRSSSILCAALALFLMIPFATAFLVTSSYPYTGSGYPYENFTPASQFVATSAAAANSTVQLTIYPRPATAGGVSPASGSYSKGSKVQVSEVTAPSYAFVNWTCSGAGCYSGTAAYYTLTMNNSVTEVANFRSTKTVLYQLIASSSPNIGGNVFPTLGTFIPGTNVTLLVTPYLNYEFTNWSCTGTGCYSGATRNPTIKMEGNITETANFVKVKRTYYLSITANPSSGGSASGAGNYLPGDNAMISAVPALGYNFTGWSCSGIDCYSGTKPTQTIPISGNVFETANFQKLRAIYRLTTIANNETGGDVLDGGNYTAGSIVPLSAAAAFGYTFVNWSCTGIGCYSGTRPYADIVMNGNVTEIGNFRKKG